MICGSCFSTPNEICTTVYPVLSPCQCDEPAPIRVEGPDGNGGPTGAIPRFTIGVVSSGGANITILSPTDFDRVMNWTLPAVPEGMAYEWTRVNTFALPSIFEEGLQTTGGHTTFGGLGLTITPDATFSGNFDAASNVAVGVGISVTTDVSINGTLTAEGATDLQDVSELGNIRFSDDSTWSPDAITEYPSGKMLLGPCGHPVLGSNIGSSNFVQADLGSLTDVNPGDTNAICDDITITVPVSTCTQATPIVQIRVKISYTNGTAPNGPFTARLWQTVIGGTQIDGFVQGDALNISAGFFELFGQVTLALGVNTFVVAVTNNTAEVFQPDEVNYWIKNN